LVPKPDHDVVMTPVKYGKGCLSTHLTACKEPSTTSATMLTSLQTRATQRSRPPSRLLHFDELRAAKQNHRVLPTTCRAISATPPDISPVAKYARSEPNFLSTNWYPKNATTGLTRSTIPSAGGLTDPPVPDSLDNLRTRGQI
jgi:hypothetical protein